MTQPHLLRDWQRKSWPARRFLALAGSAFFGIYIAAWAASPSPAQSGTRYSTEWGTPSDVSPAFHDWTTRYLAEPDAAARTGMLSNGIALASERRAYLAAVIRTNPARALALAMPASVRNGLPNEVATNVEQRVSGLGDYTVLDALPALGGPGVESVRRFVTINGKKYKAFVYGRRLGETTKFDIPLNGIAVGDNLALSESAVRELEPDEQPSSGKTVHDLRSSAAKSAGAQGVVAEMGGHLYRFGSVDDLNSAGARLEKAESTAGPMPSLPAAQIITNTQASGGSPAPQGGSPNPPTPWTTGGKNILVIRVDFPDLTGAPQGYSQATVQSVADTQIKPYYAKSSYGLTTITNTVSASVYRMPQAATYYATNDANDTLHADAETAASTDYTIASYDRVIVFFASLGHLTGSQITYGGLAQVGGPSVWCNGEFDFRVIAHEVGHTYGLYHANLWQVSDGNPISPSGVDTEYGDEFDTMGANFANSLNADFNAWFKNILGWVSDSQVQTVSTSGTYRVYAFDHDNYVAAPGETMALKVVKDGTYNYWLTCRRDFTNNASLSNGVYMFWGYNYTRQSDLLDMTTPGNSDQDAALAIGAIFTDTNVGAGVSFHPIAKGGTPPNEYRDIQITFGTLPPIAPTFSQQPANQVALLGQTATFSAAAGGNPAPGYHWQRKASGSATWANLADNANYADSNGSNLTVSVTDVAMSGDQFQCIATNSAGAATSAPPATLTVDSGLLITTLAGQTTNGGLADGFGTNAQLFYPYDVATDPGGNVYVADYYNNAVRKITPAGQVSTISQVFYGPQGIAVDRSTNIYVADTYDQVIQRITPDGTVSVLAGSMGNPGFADGTNTDAQFNYPWGIAVDSATNIYVGDAANQTIRKLARIGATQNWAVTTIAGLAANPGSADGTNSDARFQNPAGVAVDSSGNVYVADSDTNTIRKIVHSGTNWITSTIAGQPGQNYYQDGVGTNAFFYSPSGLSVDAAGNIYVADSYDDLIRKITPAGVVTTLAGDLFADAGADGFYTNAQFNVPYGVAVDNAGNIYVADTYNHTIRVGHFASVVTPKLGLSASNQHVTVSWPVATQPFFLKSATNLANPNWSIVTNQALVLNGRSYVTNSQSPSKLFYRLSTQ